MRITIPLTRSASAVALLVYLLVASLVPFADARLEASSSDPRPHVEQLGGNGCAPVHDHVACQICRVLRGPAGEDVRAVSPAGDLEKPCVNPARGAVHAQLRSAVTPPARAPPRA